MMTYVPMSVRRWIRGVGDRGVRVPACKAECVRNDACVPTQCPGGVWGSVCAWGESKCANLEVCVYQSQY